MEESSYLSLPGTNWSLVDGEDRAALARLARAIEAIDTDPRAYTPEDLATSMASLSARILATVAGEERDLREMISALRTCLAVSWDMYDKVRADKTTVSQHIDNLRDQIQGLEADLTALRLEGQPSAPEV